VNNKNWKIKESVSEAIDYHRFSDTADINPPEISESVKAFLEFKYQRGCFFGQDNLHRYGVYKLLGWKFDFRPIMKKFVVKQYGSWQEYWAPNKSLLRNSIYGSIDKILEVK